MPCFYIPELTEENKKIQIRDDEFHHIVNVFRKRENEEIWLSNGKGILAKALIEKLEKNGLTAQIKKIDIFSHPKPDIAVAFSLLKQKNDFLIVEKLTELGVREFFPVITQRTIKKPSSKIEEKYKKTAISAIKQCDNAFLPKINSVCKFNELFTVLQKEGYTPFVAYEEERENTFFDLYKKEDKICLVFGPEGGFSKSEFEYLKSKNIKTFTIGNHILRAETAAIAASAIVINYMFEKKRSYY